MASFFVVLVFSATLAVTVVGNGANCLPYDRGHVTICLNRAGADKTQANVSTYVNSAGYLVEILDEELATLIRDQILISPNDITSLYWIGLTKRDSSYIWDYSGSTIENYSNWDNSSSRDDECVVLSGSDGRWFDKECTFRADGYFIVKPDCPFPSNALSNTTANGASIRDSEETTHFFWCLPGFEPEDHPFQAVCKSGKLRNSSSNDEVEINCSPAAESMTTSYLADDDDATTMRLSSMETETKQAVAETTTHVTDDVTSPATAMRLSSVDTETEQEDSEITTHVTDDVTSPVTRMRPSSMEEDAEQDDEAEFTTHVTDDVTTPVTTMRASSKETETKQAGADTTTHVTGVVTNPTTTMSVKTETDQAESEITTHVTDDVTSPVTTMRPSSMEPDTEQGHGLETTTTGGSNMHGDVTSDVTTEIRTSTLETTTKQADCKCESTQPSARTPSIEERIPEASVEDVKTIVQAENLTANDVVVVQQWFLDNQDVGEDVENILQFTKEYLDIFDSIISSSNDETFDIANPAVFAEVCNHVLEQYARWSNKSLTRIKSPNIESEVVESPVEQFTGYTSNFTEEDEGKESNYIAIREDAIKKADFDSQSKLEVISTRYNTSDISDFGNDEDNLIVSNFMVSITVLVDGVVTSIPAEFGLSLNPIDTEVKDEKKGVEIRREPHCVFWDSDGNSGSGLWSDSGCSVSDSTDSYVQCSCEHTTNFAILMQTTEIEISKGHESALSTLSLIGLGLSTVALVLTILILVCLPSLKSDRVFIHKHLVVALIIAQSFFISTVAAVNNELICKLVAILLHYFYLAVFMWMLIEGVHLYLEIVQVFSRFDGKSKTAYYIIAGWGIPLIIVGVSVAVRWSNYGTGPGCWLSFDDGLIWAFLGPVCLVIGTNLVILLMVVRVVFRASSARGKDEGEYKHLTAALKGALFLLPLLGLTWVIGFLSVSNGTLVFQYLFVIFNSLQGLFIFLFYCAMNKEVRAALSRRFIRAALESGDSKSISLRAVARLKTTKDTRTSPVLRFNDTSNDTGAPSMDSRMMLDGNNEPVSASKIRVHSRKSESQQNLTRESDNASPFSPDYD